MKLIKLLSQKLREAEGDEPTKPGSDIEAASQLQQAFKASSVEDFVAKFKNIASDPKVQSVLKAGQTDGDPKDEVVKYGVKQLKVTNLLPTQNEIGFDQSIENIITDQYGSLESILKGKANVGGPIVTYNGKYVIDGHHRWSQVYAANPDASMEAIDLQGNLKPTEMLKVVHAAIAADLGKVPSSNPKGINILNGVSEKQVADKVDEKLTDKAKEVWAANGYKDNKAIADHIYKNLQSLINKNKPVPGAPGRKDMPQTDAGGTKVADKLKYIAQGSVNFKDPSGKDVKEDATISLFEMLIDKLDEAAYADLSGIEVGKQDYDPRSGARSTVSDIDPETGKVSWDVQYDVSAKEVHEKLDDLINFIGKTNPGSDMHKIQEILKSVKRQVAKQV